MMAHVGEAPLLNPYLDLFERLSGLSNEERLAARKPLIWAYSWAVPGAAAIRAIARHSPLFEVGAGTGYWAWMLQQAGARVTATDRAPAPRPRWVDCEATIATPPDHTLFLCWPPLNEGLATQALETYRGNSVIYVGEWRGRTAEPEFHDLLERGWRLEARIEIPRWPGFEDAVHIYNRCSR